MCDLFQVKVFQINLGRNVKRRGKHIFSEVFWVKGPRENKGEAFEIDFYRARCVNLTEYAEKRCSPHYGNIFYSIEGNDKLRSASTMLPGSGGHQLLEEGAPRGSIDWNRPEMLNFEHTVQLLEYLFCQITIPISFSGHFQSRNIDIDHQARRTVQSVSYLKN
jgi:hypothetical protein